MQSTHLSVCMSVLLLCLTFVSSGGDAISLSNHFDRTTPVAVSLLHPAEDCMCSKTVDDRELYPSMKSSLNKLHRLRGGGKRLRDAKAGKARSPSEPRESPLPPPVVQQASSREFSEVFEHPIVSADFDAALEDGRFNMSRDSGPQEPRGLERIKHGLRGFTAGPSKDLLRRLEEDGVPGKWNMTDEQVGPWRPYSELFLPGHETFKYYKHGKHTGEKMDRETMLKWMRLTNIHAAELIGVPNIFLDVHGERFGTLDWSLLKDRPATAMDDVLKMTKWRHPSTGKDVSLWQDGLLPVPQEEEEELLKRIGEPGAAIGRAKEEETEEETEEEEHGEGHGGLEGEASLQVARRRALIAVVEGVDRVEKRFKGCWSNNERAAAPKAHPQRMVLGLLQSELVAQSGGVLSGEEVEAALVAQNQAMGTWGPPEWEAHGVSAAVVEKARQAGFFLGCTDRWMLGDDLVSGGRQTQSSAFVGREMEVEGLGQISTGTDLMYRERYVTSGLG